MDLGRLDIVERRSHDVAANIAARAEQSGFDAQADFFQIVHHGGHLVDGEPVHLVGLARGDVGDSVAVGARDVGDAA